MEVQGATPLIADVVADAAGTFYVRFAPVAAMWGGEDKPTAVSR